MAAIICDFVVVEALIGSYTYSMNQKICLNYTAILFFFKSERGETSNFVFVGLRMQ